MKDTFAFFLLLFKNDKRLLRILLLFVIIQLSLTALVLETTPFFLYGMYSGDFNLKKHYTLEEIEVNGQLLDPHQLSDLERESIMSPMHYYQKLKTSGDVSGDFILSQIEYFGLPFKNRFEELAYNDTANPDLFFPWWIARIEAYTGTKCDSIKVWERKIYFDADSLRKENGTISLEWSSI